MAPASRPPTATPLAASSSRIDSPSLKAALAMALIHYKRLPSTTAASVGTSSPPLIHWKRKAKERKREILRLREELKLLQEFNSEDEIQQLSLSTDFLVELSDGIFAKRESCSTFATFSHQAVNFILSLLKNILLSKREKELVEEIIDGLVTRLMKRMCTIPENAGTSDSGPVDCSDAQFNVQHLFRKLGNEEFIGQRIILAVSQKISNVSESLLLLDPFDDSFPDMHGNMFIILYGWICVELTEHLKGDIQQLLLPATVSEIDDGVENVFSNLSDKIQLIEFLISDYMKIWLCCEQFDKKIFEEWVRSILKARKDLEVVENINGLYVVYIERVVGRLAREVAPAAYQGKLDLDVFSKLLC
uniref:Multipolar spindle 1 n=1 Tax=Aegilops tauschii TaxID=37682 RepID=M8BZL5_AEGTA